MAVSTVTATLSQGNDSVDLPLLAPGGDVLTATDYGKPHLITHNVGGSLFPRTQDQWSGLQQLNVLGIFRGTDAYTDARDLVDLVQSDGGGEPMTFDVPAFSELDSNITVAPSAEQERALNVSYAPGRRDTVEFDLGLTRVDTVLGDYDRSVSTPTAAGSGPVTLSNGTDTVELAKGLTVDRYAGRPNDVIRKSTGEFPRYEIKPKVVHDSFEISLTFTDSAASVTADLAALFREQQGRGALSLDFAGTYGMGEFSVMPAGSQGLRHVRDSGKEGISIIPTIALNRVTT